MSDLYVPKAQYDAKVSQLQERLMKLLNYPIKHYEWCEYDPFKTACNCGLNKLRMEIALDIKQAAQSATQTERKDTEVPENKGYREKIYLGDGAYARLLSEEESVMITAEDGVRVREKVYIGRGEAALLIAFLNRVFSL